MSIIGQTQPGLRAYAQAMMATNNRSVVNQGPSWSSTDTLPVPPLQFRILHLLSSKPTDAHGYAALQVPGYEVDAVDQAVGVLHQAGLLNAFFIHRAAHPCYHPSSLTAEGRRTYERLARMAAGAARRRRAEH